MNKDQFASHMRAMGFSVKVNSDNVIVSRSSEDVTRATVFEFTTFEDRITMKGITTLWHQDDDSFDRVRIYF